MPAWRENVQGSRCTSQRHAGRPLGQRVGQVGELVADADPLRGGGAVLEGLANDAAGLSLVGGEAVEHALGGTWRKIICVVDEPAWSFLCGKSWYAAVVREFHF